MTLLDVTTIARVKEAHGNLTGTSRDDFLTALVAGVSQGIEDYIDRPLMQEARTEVFDVEARSFQFWPEARPIASVASLKSRVSRATAFSAVTALDSSSYIWDAKSGRFVVDSAAWYAGLAAAEVVYTAGFATSTANFITAYPALAAAVDLQVVYEFDRATQGGQGTESIRGAVNFHQREMNWLPIVLSRWGPYRNFSLG